VIVLHWLSTFLQQRGWVIKIDRDRHLAQITTTDRILDDCPDTDLRIGVLKPRQFLSFIQITFVLSNLLCVKILLLYQLRRDYLILNDLQFTFHIWIAIRSLAQERIPECIFILYVWIVLKRFHCVKKQTFIIFVDLTWLMAKVISNLASTGGFNSCLIRKLALFKSGLVKAICVITIFELRFKVIKLCVNLSLRRSCATAECPIRPRLLVNWFLICVVQSVDIFSDDVAFRILIHLFSR